MKDRRTWDDGWIEGWGWGDGGGFIHFILSFILLFKAFLQQSSSEKSSLTLVSLGLLSKLGHVDGLLARHLVAAERVVGLGGLEKSQRKEKEVGVQVRLFSPFLLLLPFPSSSPSSPSSFSFFFLRCCEQCQGHKPGAGPPHLRLPRPRPRPRVPRRPHLQRGPRRPRPPLPLPLPLPPPQHRHHHPRSQHHRRRQGERRCRRLPPISLSRS